ncbi:MAG: FAD-binding oxidoreductase, partial [Candidatus Riflebacteria bacterium]|nr:FAD-binding oxidoreductase [Candidatus Riflebacteria bacterium]
MNEGFWRTSREQCYPRLEGRESADVVVVGGGFAGLSVAHHLSAAGRSVVILEKELIGNCGARAAGILASSLERDLSDFLSCCGEAMARQVWQFASESVSSVESLCTTLRIPGEARWSRTPSYYFFREADREYFEAEHELRLAYGFRSELHHDLAGPLQASGFRGAIVTPQDGLVDPFELSRALARELSRRETVRIHEGSGVTSLDLARGTCATGAGTARFARIVLAG